MNWDSVKEEARTLVLYALLTLIVCGTGYYLIVTLAPEVVGTSEAETEPREPGLVAPP